MSCCINLNRYVLLYQIVTALVFAGELGFDPEVDYVTAEDGTKVKFDPPTGDELPSTVR